jgi:hypothetical protein
MSKPKKRDSCDEVTAFFLKSCGQATRGPAWSGVGPRVCVDPTHVGGVNAEGADGGTFSEVTPAMGSV